MKKELESRVEEAEDELDDANVRLESLQQVSTAALSRYSCLEPSSSPSRPRHGLN